MNAEILEVFSDCLDAIDDLDTLKAAQAAFRARWSEVVDTANRKQIRALKVGTKVTMTVRKRFVQGVVKDILRKKVLVDVNGVLWRCPPSMLTVVGGRS